MEAVFIRALDHSEYSNDDATEELISALMKSDSGPDTPLCTFPSVRKLERLLMDTDSVPDLVAYLIDIVAPGQYEVLGRIRMAEVVLEATPWQRAYALACTLNPELWNRRP